MKRGISAGLNLAAGLALVCSSCGEDELTRLLPAIQVRPERIELGPTPVGVLRKHLIEVGNEGEGPLRLDSIAFVEGRGVARSSDLVLSLGDDMPRVLEARERLEFEVHHVPRDEELDLGVVRILSTDPERDRVDVRITQEAVGSPAVRLVPNVERADFEADSAGGVTTSVEAIDFGEISVGDRPVQELFVVNAGAGNMPLALREVALSREEVGLALEVSPGLESGPVLLPAIGSVSRAAVVRSARVRVSWTASAAGAHLSARLRVTTNDPALGVLEIPISGDTPRDDPPSEETGSCVPALPDPGEPVNDACATAVDRGVMTLLMNNTERMSWSDAMLYGPNDRDWTRVRLGIDMGCTLVGYALGATLSLPAGEEAQVCIHVGDCGSPARSACGTGSARLTLFPGDSLCQQYNNALPVYVEVRHIRGSPTCRPYTLSFDAR